MVDFHKALDIYSDTEDQTKCRWKQIKMMFEKEACQAHQALLDKNMIIPEDQHIPTHALNAIHIFIQDDHYWHLRGEILSDF